MSKDPNATPPRQSNLLAAILIGLPAILSIALVLHHPALHGGQARADVARSIHRLAGLDGWVHGGLMVTYGAQGVGFYLFSARLGWRRTTVVAAFMAYAASILILVIPATMDGFVTPDVIAACLPAPGGCADAERASFPIIAAMIQDFTKVALVLAAVATILWSFPLLAVRRLASRAAGVGGVLCGTVPIAILVLTAIRLQPGNLVEVVAAQWIWSLIAAALLVAKEV